MGALGAHLIRTRFQQSLHSDLIEVGSGTLLVGLGPIFWCCFMCHVGVFHFQPVGLRPQCYGSRFQRGL